MSGTRRRPDPDRNASGDLTDATTSSPTPNVPHSEVLSAHVGRPAHALHGSGRLVEHRTSTGRQFAPEHGSALTPLDRVAVRITLDGEAT